MKSKAFLVRAPDPYITKRVFIKLKPAFAARITRNISKIKPFAAILIKLKSRTVVTPRVKTLYNDRVFVKLKYSYYDTPRLIHKTNNAL